MPAGYKVPEDHPVHSFLANRDEDIEVLVTHVDTANASTRKQHFLIQLGINLVLSFLLARRIYGGLFRYGVWFLVGTLIPSWRVAAPAFDKSLLGNAFLDFFIFMVSLPMVREFLTGLAVLRFRHGFPREEIVFRKPSPSTVANIVSEAPEKRDAFMKDLLRRAVDPEEMKQSMFGLPWEEWAYDYAAMATACESDKEGVIDASTWALCVWTKTNDGWTAIEQGKEAEIQSQAGMMENMHDRLRAMGKLHVFHQVMEVVQVKTMTKDGKPLPVTEDVDAIVADIFKRNEVDLDLLTKELAKDAPAPARFARSSKKRD